MPFFSIIIPIYNSQKYLKICLKSILKQKFDDYEIILIDDHSNDDSREICENLKKKNKFQVHRNSKQLGPGLSRNVGLKLSKGKYIIFLDSDDLLYDFSLSGIFKLLENKNKIDMVVTKFNSDKPPFSNKFFFDKKFINKKDLISRINKFDYQTNVCWHYVIKRSFLVKSRIKFKDLKNCEDQEFVTRLICKINNFIFYKKNFYWHRARKGSLSQSIDLDATKSLALLLVELSKFLKKKKWNRYLKIFILRQIKNTLEQFSYRLVLYQKNSDINDIKKYIDKINLKKFNKITRNSYLIEDQYLGKLFYDYKLSVVKKIFNNLNINLIKNKNVYIFCAHVYGLAVYQELAKKNINLKSILDDNTKFLQNKTKISIKSPSKLFNKKKLNHENYKILVCARTLKTFKNISYQLYKLDVPKKNVINMTSYFYNIIKS